MADIFDDLFGDMMGRRGGRASGGAGRGSDLRYNMEITLEEAFNGKTASLKLPTSVSCEACSGSVYDEDLAVRDVEQLVHSATLEHVVDLPALRDALGSDSDARALCGSWDL